MPTHSAPPDYQQLTREIRDWAKALGFQQLGITDTDLGVHRDHFLNWLDTGFHGDMDYMQKHGDKRYRPERLVAGTQRVISVRMDYFPPDAADAEQVLHDPSLGYVSRYALGRDYHKLMRKRLQKLVNSIRQRTDAFGYRVFVDSAPVLEKALAEKAGLGWIGKHTNVINREAGSWFFLGEIYTDLPLPVDPIECQSHCGTCNACIDICPTRAIVAPYRLDARRCISYLTIELHGPIPLEFRNAIGNRIYGCDDCQLLCPWNRFSQPTPEADFFSRHPLDAPELVELFAWDETAFLRNTEGSAIRRIGYQRWLRNIAVALGNAPETRARQALGTRCGSCDELVNEHIDWALRQHEKRHARSG
jgi:epoxyqueuosine reductase